MAEVLALVKAASDYGIDIGAIWDSFRFVFAGGLMMIAVTAGFVFYRKVVS